MSHVSPKSSVKDLWAAVKKTACGRKQSTIIADGVTAESLNRHNTGISADPGYGPPKRKLTTTAISCPGENVVLTEIRMFEILDKLQNTATGLDLLGYRRGSCV